MKSTGYKESLNQYQDLVNQPTFADYLGNAFSKVGSQPAVGEAQRMSNAMLSGMGAGISGAAAEERRQKLSPMLEQAGRITAKAAELEAQMQESEQNRLLITKFIKQSAVPIAQLSQASLARDIPAANELAKGIYLNFKQGAGDPTMGDFDHYHNGIIYYHNLETGAIEGENVIGLMYQAGIDPVSIWGQDAPMIEAGLSPGAKKNYEDSEKMRQLEMEGKRADISNKYSQAGVHNAQAGLYNKQGQELDYKMSPEYLESERQKKSLDYRSDHNAKHYIPEISQKYQKNNEVLTSIDNFKKILNDTSLTGGSFGKRVARFVAEQTGNDEKILEAKNAGQFYFEWMNENSKGALSDRDIKLYTGTFADPEKNRTASINILNKLENKLKGQNTIYRKQLELYDKDPTANLHNLDLIQAPSNTNEVVTMAAPDGSTRPVPAAQVEYWKSKGAKVIDEQK